MESARLWVASIFVFAVAFLSAPAAQDRFDSPTAGIAFQPPHGWHAATLAQVQANRERVRLSDPELQAALVRRSALPIAVFMKYPEPHAGLNPSIQVTLRPALDGSPVRLLSAAIEQMRPAFVAFRIVSPVQATEVGGRPGADVRVSYTLKNDAGEKFDVLSRLWLVPRGSLMFLIGMSGAQTGVDLNEDEFAAVLDSMEIRK
jgi:hypothetical protein